MRTLILIHQFLEDLRAQKLRTTLTVLGITWGTVAVVVLLAFGVGLAEQMQRNARGMGDGIVVVFGRRTTKAYNGYGEGRAIRLREEDAALIARQVAGIAAISPEYGGRARPVRREALAIDLATCEPPCVASHSPAMRSAASRYQSARYGGM